jgi:hypothetical protein
MVLSEPEPMLREHAPLRIAIAVLGAAAVIIFLIMGLGMAQRYPQRTAFHNGKIKQPVMAMELARNQADLEVVLQTANPAQALEEARKPDSAGRKNAVCALRVNTFQDLIFIPMYAGFLACVGWLFHCGAAKRAWVGILAAGLALAAAVFDYIEDYEMFQTFKASQVGDDLARAISGPSKVKWILLGISLLLLGVAIGISRFKDLGKRAKSGLAFAFAAFGALLLGFLGYVLA